MVNGSWMFDRLVVAVRGRRGMLVGGALTGFISALVPSGFAIYPGGAGIFGGIGAACAGTATLAPICLTFLTAAAVGGEDDDRISIAHFLSGVAAVLSRLGAGMAALAQWGVFVLSAIIAGGFTGLGDGLRTTHPLGSVGRVSVPLAILLAVSAYTAILAVGVSVNANGQLRSFVGAYGPLTLFFILLAFGTQAPLRLVIKFLPAAPLWAQLPPEATGRFTLSMPWTESAAVACAWILAAALAILRCLRRGGLPPSA